MTTLMVSCRQFFEIVCEEYNFVNTIVSPNFLMWKFRENAIRQKFCGNGALPQHFHVGKLGKSTVTYAINVAKQP